MIFFSTEYMKMYSCIIHNFLEIEVFDGETDVGDVIEDILPKYMYREQYRKCVKTLEDLYCWTEDSFLHQMDAMHEFVLYQFIDYMESFQADLLSFQEIYFDEACDAMIEEASEIACEYDGELFIDLDFLTTDSLYNSRRLGDTSVEEITEINMDYYFDLLPMDIQEQYKTGHLTLTGEVSDMLGYINERISHGDLYKLFWDGGGGSR